MKGKYLGELEELILLTVGALKEKAYAVSVMDEIAEKNGQANEHQRYSCCIKTP